MDESSETFQIYLLTIDRLYVFISVRKLSSTKFKQSLSGSCISKANTIEKMQIYARAVARGIL